MEKLKSTVVVPRNEDLYMILKNINIYIGNSKRVKIGDKIKALENIEETKYYPVDKIQFTLYKLANLLKHTTYYDGKYHFVEYDKSKGNDINYGLSYYNILNLLDNLFFNNELEDLKGILIDDYYGTIKDGYGNIYPYEYTTVKKHKSTKIVSELRKFLYDYRNNPFIKLLYRHLNYSYNSKFKKDTQTNKKCGYIYLNNYENYCVYDDNFYEGTKLVNKSYEGLTYEKYKEQLEDEDEYLNYDVYIFFNYNNYNHYKIDSKKVIYSKDNINIFYRLVEFFFKGNINVFALYLPNNE